MTALHWALAAWPVVSIITGLALGKAIHMCETYEPRRTP